MRTLEPDAIPAVAGGNMPFWLLFGGTVTDLPTPIAPLPEHPPAFVL